MLEIIQILRGIARNQTKYGTTWQDYGKAMFSWWKLNAWDEKRAKSYSIIEIAMEWKRRGIARECKEIWCSYAKRNGCMRQKSLEPFWKREDLNFGNYFGSILQNCIWKINCSSEFKNYHVHLLVPYFFSNLGMVKTSKIF